MPRKRRTAPPPTPPTEQDRRYTVIRDTREQHGWTFPESDRCAGTVVDTLKTGDYSLRGYEGVFVIERKGCPAEFAKNLLERRFEAELERLEAFALPFIFLEFEVEDIVSFPENSGIPVSRWKDVRITPQLFMKRFWEVQLRYRTRVLTVGVRGREAASSLFKRVLEWRAQPTKTASGSS